MTLSIGKFGEVLMSRPAGKDAFLLAKAYILNNMQKDDEIILDFNDVKVLTPSWADEFISGIKSTYPNKLSVVNTSNESVKASLDILSI